jgi:cysteine-rich repeat protein
VCDPTGLCVPPTCTDDMQNGNETDLNCGGGDCAPCDEGATCEIATDCASGICDGDHLCTAPRCGDGVPQEGEACDDGNETNGDGCDDGNGGNCTATACGNGVVAGAETCDDGNATLGDGCDDGPAGNCTVTTCGNGVVTGAEACDDGNAIDGDCCDACVITPADHEPNGDGVDADGHAPITGSVRIDGSITEGSDELDVWRVELADDATVRFETFSADHDCVGGFDSTLRLYDETGVQLLADDDRGIGFCSALVVPLVAGTYYLSLEEYQQNNSLPAYVLEVQGAR